MRPVPVTMSRRPSRALRRVADLVAAGLVPAARAALLEPVAARYQMALTPQVAGLIDPADPDDPIARQYLPSPAELDRAADERDDPIGDDAHSPLKGIVHRYPDRVLLKPLLVCPVYCRFCFRRERLGSDGALSDAELDAALDYIRAHDAIWEVILSGGDPLILSPRRLGAIITALDAIPHVQVIRIHSRVPVADPARVSPALLRALDSETALYLAIHCNHPRELNEAARAACRRLARAGIPLLGQSVLLKGVNDDAATLEALFRAMAAARIKPYYLHQADLAPGTAQFRASIATGRRLMRGLRGRLSGLAQPTYVLDIPGGHGKVPIGPEFIAFGPGDAVVLTDPKGERHAYPPRPKGRVAPRRPT